MALLGFEASGPGGSCAPRGFRTSGRANAARSILRSKVSPKGRLARKSSREESCGAQGILSGKMPKGTLSLMFSLLYMFVNTDTHVCVEYSVCVCVQGWMDGWMDGWIDGSVHR